MKIEQFRIKNFRAIGNGPGGEGITIKFAENNLIFLSGENNTGKSSVLVAYDSFVSSEFKPTESDFNAKNLETPIEIEAWIRAESDDDRNHQALRKWWKDDIAKIKKTWRKAGVEGDKESFDPCSETWTAGGAGGFDSLLQNACPTVVWIKGMTNPEDVIPLLQGLIKETIVKRLAGTDEYKKAEESVRNLHKLIDGDEYAKKMQDRLNNTIQRIFPNIQFQLTTPPVQPDLQKVFDKQTTVEVKEAGKPMLEMDHHGHGVRRQFILTAFKGLSQQLEAMKKTPAVRAKNPKMLEIEEADGSSTRKSKMLLFEEPELYLHPDAIRSVKELIYALADGSEFQIMAATHAPVMIDLSKPHITLVRVASDASGGTRVHQVSTSLFEDNERQSVLMLNRANPYFCEAFFAKRVVIVEGDTEAIAVRTIVDRLHDEKGLETSAFVHVLNAGGKMNIPVVQKILRFFNIPYIAFHDLDTATSSNGARNPAWTMNGAIWKEIEDAEREGLLARRVIFSRDFEEAHGYAQDPDQGKPYSAYMAASEWDLDGEDKPIVSYIRKILVNQPWEERHSQKDYKITE
jgi:ABC-type branched-subunit amino acid transport system ATPase component